MFGVGRTGRPGAVITVPTGRPYQSPGQVDASVANVEAALGYDSPRVFSHKVAALMDWRPSASGVHPGVCNWPAFWVFALAQGEISRHRLLKLPRRTRRANSLGRGDGEVDKLSFVSFVVSYRLRSPNPTPICVVSSTSFGGSIRAVPLGR